MKFDDGKMKWPIFWGELQTDVHERIDFTKNHKSTFAALIVGKEAAAAAVVDLQPSGSHQQKAIDRLKQLYRKGDGLAEMPVRVLDKMNTVGIRKDPTGRID